MPARGIGGISRANLHGVLNVQRASDASGAPALLIEFNANRELPGATIRIWELDHVVFQETADLRPSAVYSTRLANPAPFGRYAVQLLNGAGEVLMTHLEGQWSPGGHIESFRRGYSASVQSTGGAAGRSRSPLLPRHGARGAGG